MRENSVYQHQTFLQSLEAGTLPYDEKLVQGSKIQSSKQSRREPRDEVQYLKWERAYSYSPVQQVESLITPIQYRTKHLTKHSEVLYALPLPLHHCQSKCESWCLLLSVNICIAYGHVAMIIETMSIYITIESTYDVYVSTTRPYPALLHLARK